MPAVEFSPFDWTGQRRHLSAKERSKRMAAILARGRVIADELFEVAVDALDRLDAIDAECPETEGL